MALAHRAGLRLNPREGGHQHGSLGLAEALPNELAGELEPLVRHLGVEGLAGRRERLMMWPSGCTKLCITILARPVVPEVK